MCAGANQSLSRDSFVAWRKKNQSKLQYELKGNDDARQNRP
jgi:hypothetical protein